MSPDSSPQTSEIARRDQAYLRRRVREEASAAAIADSLAATLIHVALATAYADRSGIADGRAWVAENRLW